MSDVRIVVQGDDLGMCRAVNEGIALAATEGILTQASAMPPTPWFGEGAATARRIGLPVGLHLTLTCEWDALRWAPLTAAPTLRDPDGGFLRTAAEAMAADPEDAITEAHAQADRLDAHGLETTYVDPHMGAVVPQATLAMCERYGVPYLYRGLDPHHEWDSVIVLSTAPLEDRAAWLVERLARLGPGTHFVLTHPGVPGPELQALAPEDAHNHDWAEPFRAADLASLCHPDVRATVERRDIELVALRDLR